MRAKIGQMLMVGIVPSETQSPDFLERLHSNNIGGVVLFHFKDDCKKKSEITKEISAVQASCRNALFVAIDQEGGEVQGLDKCNGFKDIPSEEDIGKRQSRAFAYRTAFGAAKELKEVGVNWNFSPVVDINSNHQSLAIGMLHRSLSDDPKVVSEMGAEMIRGLQDAGIVSTAKHFPGHGAISADSHHGDAVLNKTWAEIRDNELVPFQGAIDQHVDSIMVGHIKLPKMYGQDSDPASLNEALIQDIIRHRLSYDGVLISDDLDMGAVTRRLTPIEAAKKAILAGEDMLLFRQSDFSQVVNGICDAIAADNEQSKRLKQRILDANDRIGRLKAKKLIVPTGSSPVNKLRNLPSVE